MLALLEDGLASPLLAQIVEGIRHLVAPEHNCSDLTRPQKVANRKGKFRLFQGNLGLGWWKYYNLAR